MQVFIQKGVAGRRNGTSQLESGKLKFGNVELAKAYANVDAETADTYNQHCWLYLCPANGI
jgi:hypothetical protein